MPTETLVPTGPGHLTYWTEHLDTGGFVYVVQPRGSAAIKVGKALDVRARLSGLQVGNPDELRLLYVVPGDARLERHFHERLVTSRVRGEWFDGPKVRRFLTFVADVADRMVEAHELTGALPDYRSFIDLPGPPPKRPVYEVTTRRAEPGEMAFISNRDLNRFADDAATKQAQMISDSITGRAD